ncbi:hypothetical protein [Paraburkholderia atlantica]|uniref:hypothetical protein n=1 Tax=Paraburkholderia atlantica TaxID=2654982 RepID=UPI00054D6EC7|nr:hypothetical protein [Paraburkholderia atlantica]
MNKWTAVGALAAMCLSACGGGGNSSDGVTQPSAKPLTISMYGKPLVSNSTSAVAHSQLSVVSKAAASTPASGTTDAQVTVQSLTDALVARGVNADITAQVMDGTTLHQIVTTEHNGVAPTPDQFKTDPSSWLVVNFQLDDMVMPATDPAQQAAMAQFAQDLLVFSQWAAVNGKAVFAVVPIETCDTQYSASAGLSSAMNQALLNGAPVRFIGQTTVAFIFGDGSPKPTDRSPGLEHFGADCRTPDAYVQNLQVQSIADSIAAGYKEAAAAASGASATGK